MPVRIPCEDADGTLFDLIESAAQFTLLENDVSFVKNFLRHNNAPLCKMW
jgi:hypothetical protein